MVRGATAATAFIAALSVLSGCASEPTYPDSVGNVAAVDTLGHPTISVTGWGDRPMNDEAVGVMPGAPIVVAAHAGRLTSVALSGPDGRVTGHLRDGGQSWVPDGTLDYGADYTLTAVARGVDSDGARQLRFSTASADSLASVASVTDDGETVGVGQPVMINFDSPVVDKRTAQRAITIRTDPPVPGAFYWVNDSMLRWRPQHFWASGTKVTVDARLRGISLGNGVYGANDLHTSFRVGRRFVAIADDNTKTITVWVGGKVVRTMPTSMGKDSSPTNTGTYIVAERDPSVIMDSSTYGVPVKSAGGYREVVYDATRISFSGIYVHAAPWSVGDQGNTDVSNGCLNVSPDNAAWFLGKALRGDIVIVKNTVGPPLPGDDGLGDWNVPWSTWQRGNAE
ncbi:Ig-like domain-containing protein [Gordonia sp. ABSL1-1]|uniref:L,D-transpeptidase n=1 Tax=Gordonia sp. ABSL1-1 TaxID=3053923 RepID=UPI0025742323|nr:Ig-like domain-containing protein [Gordonia sp. ABSL1-1]MDL9938514.1 Ig-like domain-containing protein [Gordonia sp. ABSL1-1]